MSTSSHDEPERSDAQVSAAGPTTFVDYGTIRYEDRRTLPGVRHYRVCTPGGEASETRGGRHRRPPG
eukprot:340442-Prymnesium_polylepis.1